MKSNFFNAIIAGSVLLVTTGCQERNITMQSMRCEFVKAGGMLNDKCGRAARKDFTRDGFVERG